MLVKKRQKIECYSTPILAYMDCSKPFKLHTDVCLGFGAVLYQKQDGMDRVIAYASKTLSKSEKNYPALKLRVLGTEVGSDRFHEYLYGGKFKVYTDNTPLNIL